MTGAAQHRDAQRGPVTSGVRGGSRPSGGAKCRPSRGAKGVRRDLPGELTTAATSHFPARPKPWREVGVRGAWAREPPGHFALPRLLQLRPLVLVRSPLTRLRAAPLRGRPALFPARGGPWASAQELGATCVPISPLASQPLLPPHAPSSLALGLLGVPWAATGQASSPLQGALPKLTLRAPPCSVTLMGPFSVLGVPGRAACSTARQLGGGGGRDPSPRLLSFADHLLRSELPVKRWARVITALGGDAVTLLSLLLGPPTSPGQPWAHSRHSVESSRRGVMLVTELWGARQ